MAIKSNKEQQRHAKDDKPKIIIKKAKGHQGGHPGGAWKVAYADFVTAIIALFIVLWVLGASEKKFKAGIAHYFFANPASLAALAVSFPTMSSIRRPSGVIVIGTWSWILINSFSPPRPCLI